MIQGQKQIEYNSLFLFNYSELFSIVNEKLLQYFLHLTHSLTDDDIQCPTICILKYKEINVRNNSDFNNTSDIKLQSI